MAKGRVSKARKAFRKASDLAKEKGLELRAAETAHKRMERRLQQLMRKLSPVVKLSKEQEAELKKVGAAHSAAHERMCAVRKEWLAAIDRFCTTAEATTPRRRSH